MKKPKHWLVEHVTKSVAAKLVWVGLVGLVLALAGGFYFIRGWLSDEIVIYRWHYWLLYLLLPVTGFGVAVVLALLLRSAAEQDFWTAYMEDVFFGIRWRWDWAKDGTLLHSSIIPYCLECDRRLPYFKIYDNSFEFRCQAGHSPIRCPAHFTEMVISEIELKVRRQAEERRRADLVT